MAKLDVEVTKKGATCTLSNTSDKLESDGVTITKMYLALATIPTLIGLVPYAGATVFGYDVPPAFGLGFAATFGLALTAKIMEYTNLQNAEILVGQCPCCEEPIKQFFGGAEPAFDFAMFAQQAAAFQAERGAGPPPAAPPANGGGPKQGRGGRGRGRGPVPLGLGRGTR